MKKALVALLLGLFSISSHAVPDQGISTTKQAVSRCQLPNGVKMVLGHSALPKGRGTPEGAQMDFVTSANVVSVGGTMIPFGIYKVNTVHDVNKWTLVMKQIADNGITPPKSNSSLLVELPLLLQKAPSRSGSLLISLKSTGKTCTLHMEWEDSKASVEFAAKVQDLSIR